MTSIDEELKRIPKHPEEVINQGHDYAELLRIAWRNHPKEYPKGNAFAGLNPRKGQPKRSKVRTALQIINLPDEE